MDFFLLIIELSSLSFGVIGLLIAVLNGRKNGWRTVRGLLVTAALSLAVAGVLESVWMQKHETFRTLSSRLADRRGRCPGDLMADPATRPVATHLSLSVDAKNNWIVWRGFSLRRYEMYDCATGDFRTR